MHLFSDPFRWIRNRIPRKPIHVDELADRRRARFAHVPKTPAKRLSFRRYWRQVADDKTLRRALEDLPRADRRRLVRQWWHDQKHIETEP